MEKKQCVICEEIKELTEFYSQKKYNKEKGDWIYYNPECKECTKKKATEWKNNNPESVKVINKKVYTRRKDYFKQYEKENKKRIADNFKSWQYNNKDKIKEYNKFRQSHKKHNITTKEWEECKKYFNHRCAYCGLKIEDHYIIFASKSKLGDFHKEHVDHNGANDLSNCVPACRSCNSSKQQKPLDEWYNESNPNYTYEQLEKIHNWLEEDYKKYIKIIK